MNGLAVVFVVALFLVLWLLWRRRVGARSHTISVDGLQRRYLLASPPTMTGRQPLLLCFHGGGGRPEWLAQRSGLLKIGVRHGYAVAFPEAVDGWIDARPERGGSPRDLDFVDALLDRLIAERGIDPARIFAFGLSNGGLLVFRLACERPHRFGGFATALANMPLAARPDAADRAAPMVMVFGRRDRVMPWEGGRIARGRAGFGAGGAVMSAESTLRFWLDRNRAVPTPQRKRVTSAGRAVDISDYAADARGAPVRFVVVEDWGHRWPRWPGFNVAELIVEFFSRLPTHDTR